jgi:hypothetical protein
MISFVIPCAGAFWVGVAHDLLFRWNQAVASVVLIPLACAAAYYLTQCLISKVN